VTQVTIDGCDNLTQARYRSKFFHDGRKARRPNMTQLAALRQRQLPHCERLISPWVLAASRERHLANGKMEYSSAGEPTSLRSDAVSVQSKVIA